MNDHTDYYAVLGLISTATQLDIEKAYKTLQKKNEKEMKKYDPKSNPENVEAAQHYSQCKDEWAKIQRAHLFLQNPAIRKEYAELGYIRVEKFGYFKNRQGQILHFSQVNFNSLFPLFESFFNPLSSETRNYEQQHEIDCFATINLSDSELLSGTIKELTYSRSILCELCDGKGSEAEMLSEKCASCTGTGEITVTKRKFVFTKISQKTCERCNGIGRIIQNPCCACQGIGRMNKVQSVSITATPGSINGELIKMEAQGSQGDNKQFGDLWVQLVMDKQRIKK